MIAAPEHHTLLLENESARVLEVRIPAGAFVPVHTHRRPGVIFAVSAADFVQRDEEGKVLLDSRVTPFRLPRPPAEELPPLPSHSVEHVRKAEIRMLVVELKYGKP